MLSIVKMDFDSDVEVLDDDPIKAEVIEVDDSTDDENNQDVEDNILHNLELIPVVYTTRLDDMTLMNNIPYQISPAHATMAIINESKPKLSRRIPETRKYTRKRPKKFARLKDVLKKIYCEKTQPARFKTNSRTVKIEEDGHQLCQIDLNSVKSEVRNSVQNNTCKYSELLKLCKPCSVVLPVLGGVDTNQVYHGGKLLKANKVIKPNTVTSSLSVSSEDEVPLITFPTDLLVERNNTKTIKEVKRVINSSEKASGQSKLVAYNYVGKTTPKGLSSTEVLQRILRNGVLEMEDRFSNERLFYFVNNDSNLIDYFKTVADDGSDVFKTTHLHESWYIMQNCCWIKKDEFIQSLHPKVIMHPNARFMSSPHPCKPGACTCCCRKKKNYKKPELSLIDKPVPSVSYDHKPSGSQERDMEDEIGISVINTNRTPKLNSKDWLRTLLTVPKVSSKDASASLIQTALNYKKPAPLKQIENRRLVTLKKGDSQSKVIVFRNFAEDVTEIFEANADGDIETYLKTPCFSNTSQTSVKKLLKNVSIAEVVCCWYKREAVIIQLQNAKILQPNSVKYMRMNHSCQSNACKCCCKPVVNITKKLKDVGLPGRSLLWNSTLQAWKPTGASIRSKRPTANLENTPDCEITSVTLPPQNYTMPAAAVPPSIFVPDAVGGEDLSKEVNSLITSILDRFKDVRLTINGDGKVAAALNTPVNTLTTVELKVLANILSFAQSQVNLLGSKVSTGSTLSLSNIINLKVDDVQANAPNTQIDPKTIYKEFGKNVNLNAPQKQPLRSIIINQNSTQGSATPQPYNLFTNSMSAKNLQFNDAFSSFINSKIDPNPETATPIIANVYSLKDNIKSETTEEDSAVISESNNDGSSTTTWYRTPGTQPSTSKPTKKGTSKKRNIGKETEADKSKKLRIVSPTKLSAPNISQSIATTPVQGIAPGVYIFPKNSFRVQQSGQPLNFMPNAPMQQPILIINPMNSNSGTLIPVTTNTLQNPNTPLLSNLPLLMNTTSASQLVNANNSYITVEQPVPTASTSVAAEHTPDLPNDNLEMEERPVADDIDENDDTEDIELKYSPEYTVDEEEDCILGF